MKSATIFKMLATVLGASALFSAHAASTLTVYTALEADQIKAYQAAFEKANPDIEIKWVRDSTGIVTAKLLAEKNNPKADVIWGLAASSLAILDKEGMLESYAPKNLNHIEAKYRSAANPPSWVGMGCLGLGHLLQHRGSAKTEPAEADLVGRPDQAHLRRQDRDAASGLFRHRPTSMSAPGFNDGRRQGWAYMDALHKNIGQYTHSGSKPCKQAGHRRIPDRHSRLNTAQ